MESKYIELTYDEYVEVYYQYKSVLRHDKSVLRHDDDVAIRPNRLHWDKLGLEYYESLALGKRVFKVLDRDKWMKCWLMFKLSNGKI